MALNDTATARRPLPFIWNSLRAARIAGDRSSLAVAVIILLFFAALSSLAISVTTGASDASAFWSSAAS